MAPVLGYWNLRGLGQHIRFLLEYAGEDYQEKKYECGPAPDFDRKEWTDEKFNLGLDFPNLPYFIDGKVKLTQSNTITRYIARKHNLVAETEEGRIREDLLCDLAMDMRMGYAMLVYSPDFSESKKGDFVKGLPDKLKPLSTYLGDKPWFTGKKLNFVDFIMYEVLDVHRSFVPGCLDSYKNLVEFQKRFETLPAIAKYMASSRFIKRPFNGPMASWGGDK